MKFTLFCLVVLLAFDFEIKAQAAQIAVVRPNGITQVFTSWDSAHAAAIDGDFVYLPGTTITTPITINKKLFVYGAGHHPDSTTATARTIFTNSVSILSGAAEGSIEGIKVNGGLNLGGDNKLQNYIIKRCNIQTLYFNSAVVDSLPEYITITESIIYDAYTYIFTSGVKNCSFFKNIFIRHLDYFQYCTFKNNNFLIYNNSNPTFHNITYSLFENNIFLNSDPASNYNGNCNNIFLNNLKLDNPLFSGTESCPTSQDDNLSVPIYNDIFMSYGNNGLIYSNNFHLLPSCPGVNAGTDGNDVGIYGTNNPTVEGWVPSNPHIYFKQVDPETGADGKLHIQVGVRANNQ